MKVVTASVKRGYSSLMTDKGVADPDRYASLKFEISSAMDGIYEVPEERASGSLTWILSKQSFAEKIPDCCDQGLFEWLNLQSDLFLKAKQSTWFPVLVIWVQIQRY
jgi:hypothetical protein